MSLSSLMTAMVELVGDVLVNECGVEAPDRVLRYHGVLPDDCCSEKGTLGISWESDYPSSSFPNQNPTDPCVGGPVALLAIRWKTCWPVPDVSPAGVRLIDDQWDAKAAVIADVADCVTRAIIRLGCDPDLEDPFVLAVLEHTGRKQVRLIAATPVPALGGCAGVLWRLYARVRTAEVVS